MGFAHAGVRRAAAPEGAGVSASYAASLSMLIVCMSVFSANIALPSIAADLGGSASAQQWVVTGYTLPFAALLIASGGISDRIGARSTLLYASLVYGLVSAACPFAPSIEALIGCQVILGSSGAFILPASMALIGETYPAGRQRSHALMLWGIGGSSASAIGPVLGGALTQLHWGFSFAINAPFCLAIAVLTVRAPKLAVDAEPAPLDVVGLVLGTAGLTALVNGIVSLSDAAQLTNAALFCLAGCAVLVAFTLHERRASHPVLPLTFFSEQPTRMVLLSGFAMIFAWNGSVFASSQLLQGAGGLSSLESGFVFAPAAVSCMVGNVMGEKLAHARGTRSPLLLGGAILLAGYALLLLGYAACRPLVLAFSMCLAGMGGAIVTPVLAALVLSCGGHGAGGAASAAFNAMRQVGGTVGVAAYGAAVNASAAAAEGFFAVTAVSLLMLALMLRGFSHVRQVA